MSIGIHIETPEEPKLGKNGDGNWVVEFPGGMKFIAFWEEPGIGAFYGAVHFEKDELASIKDGIPFFKLLELRAKQRARDIEKTLQEKAKETK